MVVVISQAWINRFLRIDILWRRGISAIRLYAPTDFRIEISSNASLISTDITMFRHISRQVSCSKHVAITRPPWRAFSSTARRPLMELTGFTDEQLTVRDAVANICVNFPNTYWQECDQNEKDPKEFHAALAKDGWLGIALPEEFGGAGLGMSTRQEKK